MDFGVLGVSGGMVPYWSPIGPFKGSCLLVHGGSAAWPQAAFNIRSRTETLGFFTSLTIVCEGLTYSHTVATRSDGQDPRASGTL